MDDEYDEINEYVDNRDFFQKYIIGLPFKDYELMMSENNEAYITKLKEQKIYNMKVKQHAQIVYQIIRQRDDVLTQYDYMTWKRLKKKTNIVHALFFTSIIFTNLYVLYKFYTKKVFAWRIFTLMLVLSFGGAFLAKMQIAIEKDKEIYQKYKDLLPLREVKLNSGSKTQDQNNKLI